MKRRICVVTGTRAEYGLLKPVIQGLGRKEAVETSVVVTGSHLSREFGHTIEEILGDGVIVDERIEMLLSSDTPVGVSKSMGLAMIGFGEYFSRRTPDMVVILGDRFEALAVAVAATVARIPIAHIHGGELTAGSMDDAFRHAITKMSSLHFTATETYRRRVIQMGEQPASVHWVGSLGVEMAKSLVPVPREELWHDLGLAYTGRFALVTFHPATLDRESPEAQGTELLAALEGFPDLGIVFTKANADMSGRRINELIDRFVSENPRRSVVFSSLGQRRYLSALSHCDVVIGNSSSGIIEAPSFGVPTVNIGSRQDGRERAASVMDCAPEKGNIQDAISTALRRGRHEAVDNPYFRAGTAESIIATLYAEAGILGPGKKFHDIEV